MASNKQSASQSSHGAPSANDAQNHSPESPYYIHRSEIDPELFKPTLVLSGSDNYSKWCREMNATLASKKKLGFVNGTIAVPAEDNPMYGAWKQCNELVRSWILKAVSPEIEKIVHGMDKAAVDVWNDLKKRFSPGDDVIICDMREEIYSLKQGEGTVTTYFTKFALLWSQQEILDPLPACTCVTKTECSCGAMQRVQKREEGNLTTFLRGLDGRFDAARSRIKAESPLPSIDKVLTWLVQEEAQTVSGANQTTPQMQRPMQHQSQPPSIRSTCIPAVPETQPEKEVTRTEKLFLRVHEHELTLTPSPPEEPYKCSGCGQRGFGRSYCCESCKYFLHEECAEAVDKSGVRHPFFGQSEFKFLEKPLGRPRLCDACRKEVTGFVYYREDSGRPEDTGLDVHPCCFKLKKSITCEHVTLELRRTIPQKCLKCKSMEVKDDVKVRGWAYESSDKNYCFHVSCFKELIIDKLEAGYFSKEKMPRQVDDTTELPVTDKEPVKVEGRSKGSRTMRTVSKILSVVCQAIFIAIFGDPVSFVLTLVQALAGMFIT